MKLIQAIKNTSRLYGLQKQTRERLREARAFAENHLRLEDIASNNSDNTINHLNYISIYNMAVGLSIIGQEYADLMGIELTTDQRKAQMLIGALAKAQDRLCDDIKLNFSDGELDKLYYDPQAYNPQNAAGRIAQDLYLKLLSIIPKDEFPSYHHTLEQLHQVQKLSKLQKNKDISDDDLWNITLQKGKYAILAIHHAINPKLVPEDKEYQAIASLKYLQLIDDASDMDEDRRDGITTPATRFSPTIIKDRLIKLRDESLAAFANLDYSKDKKDKFMFKVYVFTIPTIARLEYLSARIDSNKFPWTKSNKIEVKLKDILEYGVNCFNTGFEYNYGRYDHLRI